MNIIRPRGTRDILPDEMEKRRKIENIFRNIIKKWGYREINTPTFENLELFTLKSGSGIIEELYNFYDKNKRSLALRPELTAPVMRSYINEMQSYPKPIKLFYLENCFRYERPQKGRYREFWQFGTEIIGGNGINADAEVIALAMTLLESVGICGELNIGNLRILRIILDQMKLNQENKINVLHLIDKKEYINLDQYLSQLNVDLNLKKKLLELIQISEIDSKICIEKAKKIMGETEELNYLYSLVKKIEIYGYTSIKINFGVSRGLDYYTGVVFEIYEKSLGSQKQICGGGSYNLIKLFGGENITSTGFGIGFDRISEIANININKEKMLFIISKKSTYEKAIKIAKILRTYICVNLDLVERSFTSQLTYANSIKADYVLIFGDKESNEKYYTLKCMKTGEQTKVNLEQLINELQDNNEVYKNECF